MIAQRQSHRALELLYFAILSADRRRTPARDKSLIKDAEAFSLMTAVIITDQPVVRSRGNAAILEG